MRTSILNFKSILNKPTWVLVAGSSFRQAGLAGGGWDADGSHPGPVLPGTTDWGARGGRGALRPSLPTRALTARDPAHAHQASRSGNYRDLSRHARLNILYNFACSVWLECLPRFCITLTDAPLAFPYLIAFDPVFCRYRQWRFERMLFLQPPMTH